VWTESAIYLKVAIIYIMFDNPEKHFNREHFQAESPLSEIEGEFMGGERVKFIARWRGDAPDPINFTGIYTEAEIITDLKELARRKASIKKEKHDRATLAEAFLYELIDKHELLGGKIEAIPTSEFDDLVNAVDMVLEITRGEKPYLLGVDVTISEDDETIKAKKAAINGALRNKKLTEVKYFQSEPNPPGRVEVPKVVLSITRKDLQNIAGMLHSGKDDDLVLRPLQEKLTNQIGVQLAEAQNTLQNLRPFTGRRRELISIYQKLRQSISPNS